ncbi:MAG: DNA polymerase IV, partial [Candidatus Daviesbacteria bacterium]|nr:DNA polymerase IV [Candidatus Daviesbacteria bacterium]
HIDFNSYFATVEQQANPRLRGKPMGVTGGDRPTRTVLGAVSVEAKKFGVKTGMQIWEARKLCPNIILVQGDSDKYLECTKRFINILKDYSPNLEVFSIDECFLEISKNPIKIAKKIKQRIKAEIGEWITCSIGISYNKLMAKLAGSLQKPDGLVIIPSQEEAIKVLDKINLNEICGIGSKIKKRLNNMGIFDFKQLRKAPLPALLASFKSYGQFLYNMARGIDHSQIVPFYEKEEVKSIGHRHTIDHDTSDPQEIRQVLLKLCEMVAVRLRTKNLLGKTISCWFRYGFNTLGVYLIHPPGVFRSNSMQTTITYTYDGLEIFQAAWKIFQNIWDKNRIRMIGVSVSNLKPQNPQNMTLLKDIQQKELINQTLDKINNKFGEFTLQRGILLDSVSIKRKPNPYLSDRRFKL